MKKNDRLSAVLHALLHIARHGAPMTSEALAACLRTNPVVVRRTMAALREAGLVASGRGHGGGWTLQRALSEITLRDVYAALGEPILPQQPALALLHGCALETAVDAALDHAYREAEALLAARLSTVTLAALSAAIPEFTETEE